MKTENIEINGTEVELQWGEGQGLGTAIHTIPTDKVSDCVISDGFGNYERDADQLTQQKPAWVDTVLTVIVFVLIVLIGCLAMIITKG